MLNSLRKHGKVKENRKMATITRDNSPISDCNESMNTKFVEAMRLSEAGRSWCMTKQEAEKLFYFFFFEKKDSRRLVFVP